tara:strand:+ start:356 stop:1081 length:726 start_codon:yes stop_codon:yes gene_type:complete
MKRYLIFILPFLLTNFSLLNFNQAFGQDVEVSVGNADSLRAYKTKFIIGLDFKDSYVDGLKMKFWGIKIGLQLKKYHRFGLSYHLPRNIILYETEDDFGVFYYTLDLDYFSAYYEYVFFHKKNLEISFPVMVGFGRAYIDFTDEQGEILLDEDGFNEYKSESIPFYHGEASIFAMYKLFNWFGIGGGVGYRKAIGHDNDVFSGGDVIGDIASAPVYTLKFKVFINEINRSYKRWRKRRKEE